MFGQRINETLRHPFTEAFPSTYSVEVFRDTEEVLKTERKHVFKTEHEHFCVLTVDVDSVFCVLIIDVETLVQFNNEQLNVLQTFTETKQADVPMI